MELFPFQLSSQKEEKELGCEEKTVNGPIFPHASVSFCGKRSKRNAPVMENVERHSDPGAANFPLSSGQWFGSRRAGRKRKHRQALEQGGILLSVEVRFGPWRWNRVSEVTSTESSDGFCIFTALNRFFSLFPVVVSQ